MTLNVTPTPKTGIVVPTLGTRPELLRESLNSIRKAGTDFVVLVCPPSLVVDDLRQQGLVDLVVDDPKAGPAAAINAGIRALPQSVVYCNWLGDDDRLLPETVRFLSDELSSNSHIGMYFGSCNYIDESGVRLFTNPSGQFAARFLTILPDLVPQPGALFRRQIFEDVGGLDETLRCAFDLDLFLKLRKNSEIRHVKKVLAEFRWHPTSLSVRNRRQSMIESSMVRTRATNKYLRRPHALWEFGLRGLQATLGRVATYRARRTNSRIRV